MGALDGRVAIVTGAGRGVGREEALLLAAEGAAVVVNDLGGATDGTGRDVGPAEAVVEEIRAAGGRAVANGADVSDWDAATAMVEQAVGEFGRLDVLVNNAGILRDRSIVNVEPAEWELVQAVHLRGHAATTRAAGAYWRQQAKAGEPVAASIVNTTSVSGLFGNFGQTNYGSAKAGIAALTVITQIELGGYGVRCNAIAPYARTRLSAEAEVEGTPRFDPLEPGNIAPFVGYLATEQCPIAGKIFYVHGGRVQLVQPYTLAESITKDGRWTVDELATAAQVLADVDTTPTMPVADPILWT
jgi:NAD(P)-dependent dehydrogenase (short-subunit alcohol dehydrogenase family)